VSAPLTDRQRRFIAHLRDELGDESDTYPPTKIGGKRLIDSLLRRREAQWRDAERVKLAAMPPSAELRRSIEAVAARLGVTVDVPLTAANARFVLDDLYHRERKSRRVADGSLG
jgi:hypothetical protein